MANKKPSEIALEKGMPADLDSERFLLGSAVLFENHLEKIAAVVQPGHFALESHRTIWQRVLEIRERGQKVDRVVLGSELHRFGELEKVGGLSYLTELDTGLPNVPSVDGYIRIVRDKAALRNVILQAQVMANQAFIGREPPEKIVQDAVTAIRKIDADLITKKTSWTIDEAISHVGGIQNFLAPPKNTVPTGFPALDKYIYGLDPGKLYVFGGDSGDGKSSLAANIATHIACGRSGDEEWPGKETPVEIFSLEMGREELFTRIACSEAKVSSKKLRKNWLTAEERRALQQAIMGLLNKPIHIDDTSGLSVDEFCERVRVAKRERGIHAAVLDYLQLLDYRKDGIRDEYSGVTYATRRIKETAKQEGIAMVALSQFHQEYARRKNKAERPTMNSLHGSGSIKKDADIVGLLYPLKWAYPAMPEMRNVIEFILDKHRGGEKGTILFDWKPSITTFTEKPAHEQPGYDGPPVN